MKVACLRHPGASTIGSSSQMKTGKSWKMSHEPLRERGDRHPSHWINSGKREGRGWWMLENLLPYKSNTCGKHHLHEGCKHVSNQEHMESWCMHASPHRWPTTGMLALFVVNSVKLYLTATKFNTSVTYNVHENGACILCVRRPLISDLYSMCFL